MWGHILWSCKFLQKTLPCHTNMSSLRLRKSKLFPCFEALYVHFHSNQNCTYGNQKYNSEINLQWPAAKIRETFKEFFLSYKGLEHAYCRPANVCTNEKGTYFTMAGMQQFKEKFLDLEANDSQFRDVRRAVNSQRCIRVGGKHNDLEDVGRDTYHHTLFEMLGNWSFRDYWKEDACKMAWELLTKVYDIPPERLYVTYFHGAESLNIGPDLETRDIWLNIGVPSERLIPCGEKDNFWTMGDYGPCGPCSEIHYDHKGGRDAAHLVNKDSNDVVELWNLVFMQYNRSTKLLPLSRKHVDTGMGLERLTAVLQGKTSNYDTDLFTPIFKAIEKHTGAEAYQGKVGAEDIAEVDTAYRILADHARMYTAVMLEDVHPGARGTGHKLRHVMTRALYYAMVSLDAPPGVLKSCVPSATESLGLNLRKTTMTVCDDLEAQFRQTHKSRPNMHSLDFIEIAETDDESDDCAPSILPVEHILRENNVPYTEDSYKYHTAGYKLEGKIVSILKHQGGNHGQEERNLVKSLHQGEFGWLILNKTCFYTEAGGQVGDTGYIYLNEQGGVFKVTEMLKEGQYIIHNGVMEKGSCSHGDKAVLEIDQVRRTKVMCNHTATHLLNFVIRKMTRNTNEGYRRTYSDDVAQMGSYVGSDKLTFDFTANDGDSLDVEMIEGEVNKLIRQGLVVYKQETDHDDALLVDGLIYMRNMNYKKHVRMVSIGVSVDKLLENLGESVAYKNSVELCGGTHVSKTSSIRHFVVTKFNKVSAVVYRLSAVTGDTAEQLIKDSEYLKREVASLWNLRRSGNQNEVQDYEDRIKRCEQLYTDASWSVKNDATLWEKLQKLRETRNMTKNKDIRSKVSEIFSTEIMENIEDGCVACRLNADNFMKQGKRYFRDNPPDHPVMIWNYKEGKQKRFKGQRSVLALFYIPKDHIAKDFDPQQWAKYTFQGHFSGQAEKFIDPNMYNGDIIQEVVLNKPPSGDMQNYERRAREYIKNKR
ncbi:unnamed protein product [Owenia fusiformis]|uniref:Alanine--tRNA ligase n=1 Tax=Owenia fusiformis TaxID=6347 RepID=A0A8J1UA04_OWEFU|nr:unnamed protein product [Owenia fusiformis]